MLPCTSTEMDGVLMTASTLMVEEIEQFDQDPKIRWSDASISSSRELEGGSPLHKFVKNQEISYQNLEF